MLAHGDCACLYPGGVATAKLEDTSVFGDERIADVIAVAYRDSAFGDLPDDFGDADRPDATVIWLEVGGELGAGDVAEKPFSALAATEVENETVGEVEETGRGEDGEGEFRTPSPAIVGTALRSATDGLSDVVRLVGFGVD